MKISVNKVDLFELSAIQIKVMQNNICCDIFEDDLKRRLQWVLLHKYEQCFKELKKEWDAKLLANGVKMMPTDPDEYAQLVFSQPDYKNRTQRDAESLQSK